MADRGTDLRLIDVGHSDQAGFEDVGKARTKEDIFERLHQLVEEAKAKMEV